MKKRRTVSSRDNGREEGGNQTDRNSDLRKMEGGNGEGKGRKKSEYESTLIESY